jgi:hypothetical protein
MFALAASHHGRLWLLIWARKRPFERVPGGRWEGSARSQRDWNPIKNPPRGMLGGGEREGGASLRPCAPTHRHQEPEQAVTTIAYLVSAVPASMDPDSVSRISQSSLRLLSVRTSPGACGPIVKVIPRTPGHTLRSSDGGSPPHRAVPHTCCAFSLRRYTQRLRQSDHLIVVIDPSFRRASECCSPSQSKAYVQQG